MWYDWFSSDSEAIQEVMDSKNLLGDTRHSWVCFGVYFTRKQIALMFNDEQDLEFYWLVKESPEILATIADFNMKFSNIKIEVVREFKIKENMSWYNKIRVVCNEEDEEDRKPGEVDALVKVVFNQGYLPISKHVLTLPILTYVRLSDTSYGFTSKSEFEYRNIMEHLIYSSNNVNRDTASLSVTGLEVEDFLLFDNIQAINKIFTEEKKDFNPEECGYVHFSKYPRVSSVFRVIRKHRGVEQDLIPFQDEEYKDDEREYED